MARFYGQIEGTARTMASRTGSKNSGIWAHIRGWDVGVKICGRYDETTGKDVFDVYRTGGSNDSSGDLIQTITG